LATHITNYVSFTSDDFGFIQDIDLVVVTRRPGGLGRKELSPGNAEAMPARRRITRRAARISWKPTQWPGVLWRFGRSQLSKTESEAPIALDLSWGDSAA
jgi:hypothetical protein